MMTELIGPQTILNSLFNRFPQTIPYFNKHQMKCVGCCISSFDTIEDAAINYAMPLEKLLGELQNLVSGMDGPMKKSNHEKGIEP